MAEEFFADDHIHTTIEGRHFRHGDGVEVDGEGNPLPLPNDAQTLTNLVGYVIRRYGELRSYTYPTAARALAADSEDADVRRVLLFIADSFEEKLSRLREEEE